MYGTGDADFEGAVAEQAFVDNAFADLAREQASTDAVLIEHPDLGERVGEDGIAVRSYGSPDRGVRPTLRDTRSSTRMHRRSGRA